jgi:serine/threonine-protein kinase
MPREINSEIPIGLEDITMHAMEPDLNMRFSTADEMLYSLEEFRKNPAIVFRYAKSESETTYPNQYDDYDVRPNEKSVYAGAVVPKRSDYQNQRPGKFSTQDNVLWAIE